MDIRKRFLINNLTVSILPVILVIVIFILVFLSMWENNIRERLTTTVEDLKMEVNATADRMRFNALSISGMISTQPGFDEAITNMDQLEGIVEDFNVSSRMATAINYEDTQSTIVEVFILSNLLHEHSFVYQNYIDAQTSLKQISEIWEYMKDPNFHQFFTMSFPMIVSNKLVVKNVSTLYNDDLNRKVGTVIISFPVDREYLSALSGVEANAIPFVVTASNIIFSDKSLTKMGLLERMTNLSFDEEQDYHLIDLGEMGEYYVSADNLYSQLERISNRMVQVKVADIGVFYNAEIINQQMMVFIRISLIILAAILALIIPLALISAGRITKPILKLKNDVIQFQEDMTPIQAPDSVNDEIGLLTRAFADMSSDLFKKQTEINRDFEQASMVQKAILSDSSVFDSIDGLEISAIYEPMNGLVSGDYYNVRPTPGRSEIIAEAFMVDATGHGTQAALSTMQIDVLYKESMDIIHPDMRLAFLNQQIVEEFKTKNYFTVFLAALSKSEITYACGGHNDQYLIRKRTGEIIPLGGKGIMLGITRFDKFELKKEKIEPGDVLILLTDGVFEQFNAKDVEYGEERLIKYLQKFAKKYINSWSMEKLAANIKKQVDKHRGDTPVNDDFTLMAIRIS